MFQDSSYNDKMIKSLDVFSKELGSLRTGRANANMLDLVRVDVYGQKMPINQLGTITTPEPRTINVQVWDINNVSLIDSALKKSELGLNPQIDGQLIRLPIPDLSEERRNEIKKIVKSMGEKCKVSIRNIRRDANDELKKLLKNKDISEDEEKKFEKIIQDFTDKNIFNVRSGRTLSYYKYLDVFSSNTFKGLYLPFLRLSFLIVYIHIVCYVSNICFVFKIHKYQLLNLIKVITIRLLILSYFKLAQFGVLQSLHRFIPIFFIYFINISLAIIFL